MEQTPIALETALLSSISTLDDIRLCEGLGISADSFAAAPELHARVWNYLAEYLPRENKPPTAADLQRLFGFEVTEPGDLTGYARRVREREVYRAAKGAVWRRGADLEVKPTEAIEGLIEDLSALHIDGENELVPLSSFERCEIRWRWPGWLPVGKLVLLDGDPGVGKSWLTCVIAAALTRGRALPGDVTENYPPIGSVIFSAEDDAGDTIRPRIEDAGGDPSMVHVLGRDKTLDLTANIARLQANVERYKPALMVIDPINAFVGDSLDTYRDSAVRGMLLPLKVLAEKNDLIILITRHLTKGGRERSIYRGQGSIAYIGAVRSGMLLDYHPDDLPLPKNERRRVLASSKVNIAAAPISLVFTLKEGRFQWLGATPLNDSDLGGSETSHESRELDQEIEDFLSRTLSEGPRRSVDVLEEGREAHGFTEKLMRKAQKTMNVQAVRVSKVGGRRGEGDWEWRLPDGVQHDTEPPVENGSNVEKLNGLKTPDSDPSTIQDDRPPEY